MKRRKTINIEPFDVVVSKIGSKSNFTITITDKNKRIVVLMPRYFIAYIAEQLHETINGEQSELDKIKQAMRGEKSH